MVRSTNFLTFGDTVSKERFIKTKSGSIIYIKVKKLVINTKFWMIIFLFFCALAISGLAADVEVTFLNQEPDPAEPGEYVELRYNIENKRSDDLTSLKIELEQNYPFSFDSKEDRIKVIPVLSPELQGKKAVVVKFRARIDDNAIEGEYNTRLMVSSLTYPGITVHENTVVIKSREMIIAIDSITTEPIKPKPGEEVVMDIILRNMAYSPVYDVKVKLNLAGTSLSPLGSACEKILRKIGPQLDASVQLKLAIDAHAESAIHKVPIQIEFKDKFSNVHSIESVVGIPVFAKPEYIMNLEDSKVYVTKQQGDVIVSISNNGISDLNFVTLEMLPTENYDILSNAKIYLGTLESDDYETAEFNLYTKKAVGDMIPLKMELKFKDSYNKEYKDEVSVPLKIYSRNEAAKLGLVQSKSPLKPLIVLIILGVIGFFAYRKWRKKRN